MTTARACISHTPIPPYPVSLAMVFLTLPPVCQLVFLARGKASLIFCHPCISPEDESYLVAMELGNLWNYDCMDYGSSTFDRLVISNPRLPGYR